MVKNLSARVHSGHRRAFQDDMESLLYVVLHAAFRWQSHDLPEDVLWERWNAFHESNLATAARDAAAGVRFDSDAVREWLDTMMAFHAPLPTHGAEFRDAEWTGDDPPIRPLDFSRTRRHAQKPHHTRTQLQVVGLRIQTLRSIQQMAEPMRGATLKASDWWTVEDNIEDEEADGDRILKQVLDEIGVDLSLQPSPGGWSDLPSDAKDPFFFSTREMEDYRCDMRRRVLDDNREARLRALRDADGSDNDDPKSPKDDWGGSDEELT
ncbi:uncharacterized protein BXZ73DRAFT_103709 [Epithele typhae]|uniref:uncharacterized protein n=1 Tax=Epithele typhae TaxID=378194 RepID=UPI002008463C|nr:uncharacterized protein BXZ73DRAFT_103709 [Epithele typhae]KAH9923979.1 hypothetical protein BXZ73DRAFT_103709 [Epithele typhae]